MNLLEHPYGSVLRPAGLWDVIFRNIVTALIAGWENSDIDPRIIQVLRKLVDSVGQKTFVELTRNDRELNVLIHGEAGSDNILFSYGPSGRVQDAKLVSKYHFKNVKI